MNALQKANPAKNGKETQLQRARQLEKKKKTTPLPILPQPNEKDSALKSENEITLEVEQHTPEKESGFNLSDVLNKAGKKVKEGLFDDDKPLSPKSKSKKKNIEPGAGEEEFYSLVVAGVVLVISFWKVPREVKPNQDEIDIFSSHLSKIAIRHLPAATQMSPDLLDMVGMFAVASSYYARVSDDLKLLPPAQPKDKAAVPVRSIVATTPDVKTDLDILAPGLSDYLKEAEARHGAE